jgi:hypothetical protein
MGKTKLNAPVLFTIFLEADQIVKLDRQAKAISKKHGFHIYKADIIREVLANYLEVSGV